MKTALEFFEDQIKSGCNIKLHNITKHDIARIMEDYATQQRGEIEAKDEPPQIRFNRAVNYLTEKWDGVSTKEQINYKALQIAAFGHTPPQEVEPNPDKQ